MNKPTLILSLTLAAPLAQAETAAPSALDLGLEELMSVVVTSVSKKAQTLAETAAAVHVISAEDIRRSGAGNIPEALRLAPGVQVSAIGQNKWAVSIRGFADRFANKLLVLVDGRTVYTPLFSGVIWENLDVPLENIERIEVIRGPGASIWGANAVNGVINILTRSAFDSEGGHLSLAAGNELKGQGYARYGWKPNPDTAVVLHAKLHDYDAGRRVGGGDGADDWRGRSAGFDLEHLPAKGTLRVQGGVSRTHASDELTMVSVPPANTLARTTEKVSTEHLLVRWENAAGETHRDSLQGFLEHSEFDHLLLSERRYIADMEFQQQLKPADGHDLIWGLGYRYSTDDIVNSPMGAVTRPERDTSLYSLYAQDDITLVPERWRLTLGARLEHNDYTGYVFEPNLRLLWTPDAQTSAWLSLARAARTPSRVEGGVTANMQADPVGVPPFVPPSVVQAIYTGHQKDEHLNALDLGWRHQLTPKASLDLAAFYYRYDQLSGAALAAPTLVLPAGYLLVPMVNNNANSADVHGLEASLDWRPTDAWRLQAHYSLLRMHMHTGTVPGQTRNNSDDDSPSQQFSLRSSLDLNPALRWDAWLRHVGRIERYAIPTLTTLDMRLAWQAGKDLELAVVGQNLLDDAHLEYGSQLILSTPSEVQRGVYVTLDWKF